MHGIIKIIKSLENSALLIDGAAETVKHEIKNQEGGFVGVMMTPTAALIIAPMASSLTQPVASSLINAISEKRVMKEGKGEEGGTNLLLSLPLMVKFLAKGVIRAGKGYNNIYKFLVLLHPLSNSKITKHFNYEPWFNAVYSRDNLPGRWRLFHKSLWQTK